MEEKVWNSLRELSLATKKGYSVTDKAAIRKQYINQIKQYPLYLEWFNRIENLIKNEAQNSLDIIEYGSGPGLLTGKIVNLPQIRSYKVVEPLKVFREMTAKETNGRARIVEGIGENFTSPNSADIIITTATYHHFADKLKALKHINENLRAGGRLIVADVFLPEYKYDLRYQPRDKAEFLKSIISYTSEQILGMPNPRKEDVVDQIRTCFLDVLRDEEFKVCLPILKDQLKKSGFLQNKYELMTQDSSGANFSSLGYYFIVSRKKGKKR